MFAAVLLKLLKKNKIACGVRCCIAEIAKKKQHKIINRSTELCHHRTSSTEKQSSAIIVHEAKRTATSTRTTHTRQNNPYRLGAAPAGVGGARSRCCPAATVPAAVVFACGVRCCIVEIAEIKQNEINNRKTDLCHHRPQTKAHSNEYENNTHKAEQALPAWRGAGRSSRDTKPLLSSLKIMNDIIHGKTGLCFHRSQTESRSNRRLSSTCGAPRNHTNVPPVYAHV